MKCHKDIIRSYPIAIIFLGMLICTQISVLADIQPTQPWHPLQQITVNGTSTKSLADIFKISDALNIGIGMNPLTGVQISINGKIGAEEFCDKNGNNCLTHDKLGGKWTPSTTNPNNIVYNSGNVGIGVTDPGASALRVGGSITASGEICTSLGGGLCLADIANKKNTYTRANGCLPGDTMIATRKVAQTCMSSITTEIYKTMCGSNPRPWTCTNAGDSQWYYNTVRPAAACNYWDCTAMCDCDIANPHTCGPQDIEYFCEANIKLFLGLVNSQSGTKYSLPGYDGIWQSFSVNCPDASWTATECILTPYTGGSYCLPYGFTTMRASGCDYNWNQGCGNGDYITWSIKCEK